MDMQRPNPFEWIGYAFGGRLPDRYREWVLHDSTSRTWLWRFGLRIVVQALPWLVVTFVVLTVFTPLPFGYVFGAVLLALALSLFFAMTSADELTEARLVKHGFPPGTGKSARRHAHD